MKEKDSGLSHPTSGSLSVRSWVSLTWWWVGGSAGTAPPPPGPHHLAPVRGLHSPLSANPPLASGFQLPSSPLPAVPALPLPFLEPASPLVQAGATLGCRGHCPPQGCLSPSVGAAWGGGSDQVQVKLQHFPPPPLAESGLWPTGAGWAGSPGTGTGTSPGTGQLTHTGRGPQRLPSSHLHLSHWRAGSHWALARGRATEAHLEGLGTDSKWPEQGRCLCTPSPLLGKRRGRTNPHTLILTQQGQGC